MNTYSRRGDGGVTLLAVLAVVGFAGWLGPKLVPSVFDSRTKDAERSVETTKQIETAVQKAVEAEEAKGAKAAASVSQMVVAAGQLDKSPQRDFIIREGTVVVPPLLPAPDPAALLAAEKRRVAILEGKLELENKLYAEAVKDTKALLARAEKAEARTGAAIKAQQGANQELVEAAAEQRGKDAVIGLLAAVAALAAAGWIYARVTGFSKVDIARIANRVRAGMPGLDAIDAAIPDSAHMSISRIAAELRAREAAEEAARKAKISAG